MQNALAHPSSNPAYHRFALAYHGQHEALHAYFAEALQQAESPEIDVEAGEGISWELHTILLHLADARFASALATETDPTRSAVANVLSDINTQAYPQTSHLLSSTPKIDFPMLKTYRGDYKPAPSPSS
jgi:hypothetical protein